MTVIGYLVGTPPQWATGVSRFAISGADPKYELVGPCPRCEHTLSKDVSNYVLAPAYGGGSASDVVIRVKCNCDQPHEGQPDGVRGCGAEGTVEVAL